MYFIPYELALASLHLWTYYPQNVVAHSLLPLQVTWRNSHIGLRVKYI